MRLIADDLTGALDAGAAFAAARGTFPIFLGAETHLIRDCGVDTDSRGMAEEAAVTRIRALCGTLADADIAFKKIDSLMRGNTLAEIATVWRSGRFRAGVLAPAIPSQRRIVRRGQMMGAGAEYGAVADIAGALRARGVPVVKLTYARRRPGAGVYLCDASNDQDLRRLARANWPAPTIWFGASGLARALAGGMRRLPVPSGPALILSGSANPIARAQLDAVASIELRAAAQVPGAVARAREALARGASAAIGLAVALDEPTGTWRALARELARGPAPALLAVTGGASLRALCEALGINALLARGEVSPGVPLSTIDGGCWHGATLLSKSGAFDDRGLQARLMARGESAS